MAPINAPHLSSDFSHLFFWHKSANCVENFITVITPAVYDYQYLPEVAVSKKSHVTFRVRAGADAHVALSTMYGETDRKTYELVLGGWNNSRSAVRYGGRGPVVAQVDTPGLLDAGNFQSFWISWDSDAIQVISWSLLTGLTTLLLCIVQCDCVIVPLNQYDACMYVCIFISI